MVRIPEKPPAAPAPRIDTPGPGPLLNARSDIFFAAVETTRMPMIVTDPHAPDNPILFANPAFLDMTGYGRDEVIGRNCRFLQGTDTNRGTIDEIRSAIAARQQFATEILNYRKDGSSFWNALFLSPVFDHGGALVYFFGSQLDVSRRRDAELALAQAQRMEALGRLTGGIAHDFNNLLQVIGGYTDVLAALLRKPSLDPARVTHATDSIRTAVDRAAKLTGQLLAFARKQRLEGRPISLNGLVTGMADMARQMLGDSIVLQLELAPDLRNARLDPTQAEVALLNVLINARDAMAEGGTVTVSTANRVVGAEARGRRDALASGAYVELAVRDTGSGMTPEVLARVMEPFFTTKGEGKGTGLGLATVYGFARQSGGTVTVESAPGSGTTLRLLFPATDATTPPAEAAGIRAAEGRGTETVLIVDDRPDVAEIARTILEGFGYRPLVAHAPAEALAMLDAHGSVDLLFTDLMMPGMNGAALARAALERRPGLKVLLATGYAEATLDRTDGNGRDFEMLVKPYRQADLVRHVRRVLDGAAALS